MENACTHRTKRKWFKNTHCLYFDPTVDESTVLVEHIADCGYVSHFYKYIAFIHIVFVIQYINDHTHNKNIRKDFLLAMHCSVSKISLCSILPRTSDINTSVTTAAKIINRSPNHCATL